MNPARTDDGADESSDNPAELYRARGPAEAHALRIQLENEGIAVRIDNEMLQGIVGEVPGGWVTAPRILVARSDLSVAQAILDAFQQQAVASAADQESETFRCLACRSPMGIAETCPACGWTYSADPVSATDGEATVTQVEATNLTENQPPPESTTELPAPIVRPGWGEVVAVLAVGVFPPLLGVITRTNDHPVLPYWADTVDLIGLSACSIFVCLYLIRRSGEPWSRFGLGRPGFWDVPLGIVMLLVAHAAWITQNRMGLVANETGSSSFPLPRGPADYCMMVAKYSIGTFSEELICRAYLITRLEVLLRSRTMAVVAAAALFASYHSYQGMTGVVYSFLFGAAFGAAFLGLRRIWPLALGHALWDIGVEMSYVR